MDSVTTAARLLRPGDYCFTIDMWSGYHQLALQENLRPFACFKWRLPEEEEDQYYQWQVVPFGLNVAPRVYTEVMAKLFTLWRIKGYRCSAYIDDGIWAAESRELACKMRDDVLTDLQRFGLVINRKKAHLRPAQAVRFLGYILDTAGPRVRLFVPDDKLGALVTDVGKITEQAELGKRTWPGRSIASVVGRILAMRYALPPARLMTRELLACLRQLPLRTIKKGDSPPVQARNYDATVTLSEGALAELRFFEQSARAWNGAEWFEATPTRVLYTDACSSGYGAVLHGVDDEGRQIQHALAWTQGELNLPEADRGSTRTELRALLEALCALEAEVQGETLLHCTDSQATRFGLENGGYCVGENSSLNLDVRRIWAAQLVLGVRLHSRYVGSAAIIESKADELSRTAGQDEGFDDRACLRPWVWSRVMDELQVRPEVDLFCEPELSPGGLPYFVRRRQDAGGEDCLGVDALAQPWIGSVYGFPPTSLIQTAVEKAIKEVQEGSARLVVLVLPNWSRPWRALLHGFKSVEVGTYTDVVFLPEGAKYPITSERIRGATKLEAFLIERR